MIWPSQFALTADRKQNTSNVLITSPTTPKDKWPSRFYATCFNNETRIPLKMISTSIPLKIITRIRRSLSYAIISLTSKIKTNFPLITYFLSVCNNQIRPEGGCQPKIVHEIGATTHFKKNEFNSFRTAIRYSNKKRHLPSSASALRSSFDLSVI